MNIWSWLYVGWIEEKLKSLANIKLSPTYKLQKKKKKSKKVRHGSAVRLRCLCHLRCIVLPIQYAIIKWTGWCITIAKPKSVLVAYTQNLRKALSSCAYTLSFLRSTFFPYVYVPKTLKIFVVIKSWFKFMLNSHWKQDEWWMCDKLCIQVFGIREWKWSKSSFNLKCNTQSIISQALCWGFISSISIYI